LQLIKGRETELHQLAEQLLEADVLHFDDVLSILGPRPHEDGPVSPSGPAVAG